MRRVSSPLLIKPGETYVIEAAGPLTMQELQSLTVQLRSGAPDSRFIVLDHRLRIARRRRVWLWPTRRSRHPGAFGSFEPSGPNITVSR